jgi:Tol biopolymer transport system component/DNA-binding winged helix-turn-helix (wHTH) protein
MATRANGRTKLCFSIFEVDLTTNKLFKRGVSQHLQEKPFQILAQLLERPGEVVTREELQKILWPDGTFVDFDKGLNTAVKKLRQALGDSPDAPVFIETQPRKGYRFIAPVFFNGSDLGGGPISPALDSGDAPQHAAGGNGNAVIEGPQLPPAPEQRGVAGTKTWTLPALLLCLLAIAVVAIWLSLRSSIDTPKVIDSAQITKDGLPKSRATLKLVSDGARLYFQEGSLDETEQNTALVQVATQGGETARIPISLRNPMAYDFSQIRSELLLGAGEFQLPSNERPLWALPLPAGPPHRLGDIIAHDACWVPDGRHLAFANGKDVFLAAADGSDVRKLATADGFDFSYWIRFSPDGRRVRFSVIKFGTPDNQMESMDVMEMAVDGSGLHPLPIHGGCGAWSADGGNYFYQKGRDTWVLPEQQSLFGKVRLGNTVQLTAGPIGYSPPTPSADGKQLFVIGQQGRVELMHYAADSKEWVPFLGGISAGELEVSPDGQWVTYTTFPEFDLWRSKLDGSERLQLTFEPINAHEPRWSPDGKQILFTDFPYKIFVVPANGGAPRQLMPADHPDSIGAGAWLPDGSAIIFGRHMGCPGSDNSCWGIFRLDLQTQQVSKIPGSDGMVATRLSHDGHYLTALFRNQNRVMLYDLQTQKWSELAKAFGSMAWSHDSKSIYVHLKHETKPAELVRISVPNGHVQRVADLKGLTLGGLWPDWLSLLPDDSPLLMLDRSTEEIYRLDLQYH